MTCLAVQFAAFPRMEVGVGCVEDGTMGWAIFTENVGEGSGKETKGVQAGRWEEIEKSKGKRF